MTTPLSSSCAAARNRLDACAGIGLVTAPGHRLIIQRAVEDEFDARPGRARYERRPPDRREERTEESGLRNGLRLRTLQTAEGEREIEIGQVRLAAEAFASRLFPARRSCWGPSR
jgi:hypothetical protein